MKIDILYHAHYFERDLFLLNIDGAYTMVYRSSGLNGGRVGRVIPYNWLKDSPVRFSDAREVVVPGYIFKEFFYRGFYKTHGKRLDDFPDEISEFVLKLEELLGKYDASDSEIFEDFEQVMDFAKKINSDMREKIKEMKVFDWYSLVGK